MPGQQAISIAYQAEFDAGFDRLEELTLLEAEAAGSLVRERGDNVACTWLTADIEDPRHLGISFENELHRFETLPVSEREFQLARQAATR